MAIEINVADQIEAPQYSASFRPPSSSNSGANRDNAHHCALKVCGSREANNAAAIAAAKPFG
jgi:hypothetical protein